MELYENAEVYIVHYMEYGKFTCTYTGSHTPAYTSLNLTTTMHNLFATFPTQMATMISGKQFVVVFLDNVTNWYLLSKIVEHSIRVFPCQLTVCYVVSDQRNTMDNRQEK